MSGIEIKPDVLYHRQS